MVRELRVDDPSEGKLSWETETELLHEMVYLGIELPDNLVEQRRERLGFVPYELNSATLAAQREWDSYHVWLEGKGGLVDSSPRERLSLYLKERDE